MCGFTENRMDPLTLILYRNAFPYAYNYTWELLDQVPYHFALNYCCLIECTL